MIRRNIQIKLAVLLLVLIALFQNCTRVGFGETGAIDLSAKNNGNGGHYDGKISYVVIDHQSVCSDGSPVRSQIDKIENSFYMVRENCANADSRELDSSQVTLDPDWQSLFYAGLTFDRVRDPWLQPYSSKSLWNISVGSGAQWSGESDADTRDLRTPGSLVFAGEWSVPVFLAQSADPQKTFQSDIADQILRVPPNFHLSLPTADGINAFVLMEPTRRWFYHYSGCRATAAGYSCMGGLVDDACSDGLQGYDLGRGIIRKWEIESGEIQHAVRFALPSSLLSPNAEVWPMQPGDFGGGKSSATGNILYGSTVGIPASVDLNSLGLSRGGFILARALQNYGALHREVSGLRGGINFFAEESAEKLPQIAEMRSDLPKIVSLLRILRNQSAATPQGGGAPRQPALPVLDPGICR